MSRIPDAKTLSEYPKDLISKISTAAITHIRDDGFFKNISEDECVYLDVLPKVSCTNLTVSKILCEYMPGLHTMTLQFEFSEDDIMRACEVSKGKNVILGTCDALLSPSQQRLCTKIHSCAKDLCVIAMKNPHDINAFDFVRNYICVYEYTFCSVNALSHYLIDRYKH